MKNKPYALPDIAAAAKKLLGFPSLRPGQETAIRALIDGRDTLVVQPTGSGKSAIYQIAGALLPGVTLVVSPLIALQKDQADAIRASKLEDVAVVNSTLSAKEQRDVNERIEDGEAKYIFLAPEQLHREETLERLRQHEISLIAIDEAHCVSQWGHDFRPAYLELSHVIDALGYPPVLAMTATASPEVRAEIIERLGLRDAMVQVRGFDRPNISLRVDSFSRASEKRDALLRRVEFSDKPGIIYVSTHKHAEEIASDLLSRGVEAVYYHGGLKAKDRVAIQDRFMNGDVPVIVATNAFGMGVDKPDIRFVYHADVSDSLDAYYQEIGRAGRDGEPAEGVLFFCPGDIGAQQYKTGGGQVSSGDLDLVVNTLRDSPGPIARAELAERSSVSLRKLSNVLHKLEEIGAVRLHPSGEVELMTDRSAAETVEAAEEKQQALKELRKRRLEQMRAYAVGRGCRREMLLHYFGDNYEGPCGNCDRCEAAGAGMAKIA